MAETSNGGTPGGGGKALRRYGPIVLAVVLIGAVVDFAGSSGDDEDDTTVTTTADNSDLPMTYEEAVAAGTEGDIEWGEGCDTELGLLKVPMSNAAPCVEPWDETADNGGATTQGVTADEILVV